MNKSILNNMGLSIFSSSSFEETNSDKKALPNPDPKNYKILSSQVIEGFLIVEVKYFDCTNYEGRKIMLYDTTLEELESQKYIDPHFSDNKSFISPIARFEPTPKGWFCAEILARNIKSITNTK